MNIKDKRIKAVFPTDSSPPYLKLDKYKADFLWPHEDGSVEQAGYEFANANTEGYRKVWWLELISRIRG